MIGLSLLIFGGAGLTALYTLIVAFSEPSIVLVEVVDDPADLDRIENSPYTPPCLWWEAMQ